MRSHPLSPWDHLQLIVLRWLSAALMLVDGLLDVQWGARLLDGLTNRWQMKLSQIERTLAHLDEDRKRLSILMEAIAIHTALIYLAGRYETRNELRFDPADPRDERLLEASIDTLVKEQLAAIETEERAPGQYVYTLELDWTAIRGRLANAAAVAESELSEWLREGIRYIDRIGDPTRQAEH